MVFAFVRQMSTRDSIELAADERQHFIDRGRVAILPSIQKLGDVCFVAWHLVAAS